jgi:hypothetical protein
LLHRLIHLSIRSRPDPNLPKTPIRTYTRETPAAPKPNRTYRGSYSPSTTSSKSPSPFAFASPIPQPRFTVAPPALHYPSSPTLAPFTTPRQRPSESPFAKRKRVVAWQADLTLGEGLKRLREESGSDSGEDARTVVGFNLGSPFKEKEVVGKGKGKEVVPDEPPRRVRRRAAPPESPCVSAQRRRSARQQGISAPRTTSAEQRPTPLNVRRTRSRLPARFADFVPTSTGGLPHI